MQSFTQNHKEMYALAKGFSNTHLSYITFRDTIKWNANRIALSIFVVLDEAHQVLSHYNLRLVQIHLIRVLSQHHKVTNQSDAWYHLYCGYDAIDGDSLRILRIELLNIYEYTTRRECQSLRESSGQQAVLENEWIECVKKHCSWGNVCDNDRALWMMSKVGGVMQDIVVKLFKNEMFMMNTNVWVYMNMILYNACNISLLTCLLDTSTLKIRLY